MKTSAADELTVVQPALRLSIDRFVLVPANTVVNVYLPIDLVVLAALGTDLLRFRRQRLTNSSFFGRTA